MGVELLVDVSTAATYKGMTAAAGVAGGQRSLWPKCLGRVVSEALLAVCGTWQTAAAELWH